jgi:hypothetical protein
MPRRALARFFERVIVASLPLAVSACGDTGATMSTTPPDLAVVLPASDLGSENGDLAGTTPILDFATADLDSCEQLHPVTAVNMPASYLPDGGFHTLCTIGHPCIDVCPPDYVECCSPRPSDGGAVLLSCVYTCGPAGRRPAGLHEAPATDGCAVGRYFAAMAHLEAASVHAFRSLGRELLAHGAPARLIAAARRAARDEIRHARATRLMARAHGSRPAPVQVTVPSSRSLEKLAIENAVEGCVRETFGALLASWQAQRAGDPGVREMMIAIAADETRHAQLAWDLDAWAKAKLDRAARRRVTDARRAAVDQLAAELAEPPPAELVDRVGLPDAERARHFLAAAKNELWS